MSSLSLGDNNPCYDWSNAKLSMDGTIYNGFDDAIKSSLVQINYEYPRSSDASGYPSIYSSTGYVVAPSLVEVGIDRFTSASIPAIANILKIGTLYPLFESLKPTNSLSGLRTIRNDEVTYATRITTDQCRYQSTVYAVTSSGSAGTVMSYSDGYAAGFIRFGKK